ncbi:sugar phosphate isomerase/epimerase family protein [Caldanaerobius fijiensis]|nr:sugar phosphate isomerase/epimerase family protein [Caldanaerobius fijiensis]
MMKISYCWLYAINRYGYPPTIDNAIKALEEMHDMGFKYVEVEGVGNENMREVYENRRLIKEKCDELGLKIINFCPILPDIASMNKELRERAFEAYELGVETAKYFQAETVQTDSFTPPLKFKGDIPYKEAINYGKVFNVEIDPAYDWEEHWGIIVESYRKCSDIAEKNGMKFCLEPRVGELISNTDAFLRLYDHVGSKNFGMVLDTGHQHAQKEILPLSVEKAGKKIFYVHVSDNDGRINEHLALGEGTIDWEGVFTALKKHDFNGYVAIDIGGVKDLRESYISSKNYLVNLFKKLNIEYDV